MNFRSTVECVVVTEFDTGLATLVRFPSGLTITPWHPIWPLGSSRWVFPAELMQPEQLRCSSVYSFVLSKGASTVVVNGVPAVCLAHNLVDEPVWVTTEAWSGLTTVVEHPYFGTAAVLRELRGLPGWHTGRVVLPSAKLAAVRDEGGHGLVTGLQLPPLTAVSASV